MELDLCLSGLDDCGFGPSSPLGREVVVTARPSDVAELFVAPSGMAADNVAPVAASSPPGADPCIATSPPSPASFVNSLRIPLVVPLLRTTPRVRTSRAIDDEWVPRRSDRLAAKSAFRDPQPEKQAKRVLVNKWTRKPENAPSSTPDAAIASKFHDTFTAPLSSSKRAAMRELFPRRAGRGTLAPARLF